MTGAFALTVTLSDKDGGYLVPEAMTIDLGIMFRAVDEGWDRRRLKRELRKGMKSTYTKRAKS